MVTQIHPAKEFLMTFVEEEGKEEEDTEMFGEPPRKKRKGVYYKDIFFRTLLRKTRALVSGKTSTAAEF